MHLITLLQSTGVSLKHDGTAYTDGTASLVANRTTSKAYT